MRLLLADDESTLRRAASELLLSRGKEEGTGECVSEKCESVKSLTLDQRREREREIEREICMDMWKRG